MVRGVAVMVGLVVVSSSIACGPPRVTTPRVTDCPLDSRARGEGPTTELELQELLDHVRETLFEELDLVRPLLAANPVVENETSFLQANLEPASALQPRLHRSYVVRYSPLLLEDPPPARGVAAILAHELRHVADYVELGTLELAGFGLGYLVLDPAPYERQTDTWVVKLGCADGLKDYRVWNYARLDEEALAEKQRRYLTPDEIDALVAELEGERTGDE
jgi:hypothetical protein